MISYLIWNASPEIFSIGPFALRWYGLLFALGFLISQQILYYIHKTEGKPEKDVDTLTIYMVIATILGARLGHVLFYQPSIIWENPLGIILPFEFNPFRFTGLQGLASHGGAIGILFALWLYSRKRKPGQSYLQVLDRIVILVCLTGALIRLGNFFNSEIIGKPSESPFAFVFAGPVTESIKFGDPGHKIGEVEVKKDKSLPEGDLGRVPIDIYVFFSPGVGEIEARELIAHKIKSALAQNVEFIDQPFGVNLKYELTQESAGTYAARIKTFGIARHPAQIYESISCILLFSFLFWYWSRYKSQLPQGRIFGIFLIVLWSLRFAYEFLKENQVSFENSMSYNMGQILSIPLIIVGIWVFIRSYRVPPTPQAEQKL